MATIYCIPFAPKEHPALSFYLQANTCVGTAEKKQLRVMQILIWLPDSHIFIIITDNDKDKKK